MGARPAGARSLAFQPNDPLLAQQWYIPAIHGFDFWPQQPTNLAPVLVAVVDSGIDAHHPEFQGRIAEAKSFVSSPPTVDSLGHGTMVAGEIAAALDNGQGIAGLAFPARLLIAKVVDAEGDVTPAVEARGIRWAVDHGARVINISLGATRNPSNRSLDEYSAVEQDAVGYAYGKGAVIVAPTGNCGAVCPYGFAAYPAALPHVLGVSALAPDGSTPDFSNRDPVYNDIAAPGAGIVSTFPLALGLPGCKTPGYSPCASDTQFQTGDGTSFAAPLVTAAAALLLAVRPDLQPSQVMAILEHTTDPVGTLGRSPLTGAGRLDVARALAALAGPLPPADRFEPDDDGGPRAFTLYGRRRIVDATLDYYDDPIDVYRIYMRPGQRLALTLTGPEAAGAVLALLPSTAEHVAGLTLPALRRLALAVAAAGAQQSLRYPIGLGGWYEVVLRATEGSGGGYRLVVDKI